MCVLVGALESQVREFNSKHSDIPALVDLHTQHTPTVTVRQGGRERRRVGGVNEGFETV